MANAIEPWVILDRDGVINEDSEHFIKSVAEWRAIPGSLSAMGRLTEAKVNIAVATNQSGLARGLFLQSELDKIHHHLESELNKHGGRITGIFFCPHGPSDNCDCRKPKTGLLEQIESQFDCQLKDTPFVGDALRDIQAAISHGCHPVLVKTGKGKKTLEQLEANNSELLGKIDIYDNLATFVDNYLN